VTAQFCNNLNFAQKSHTPFKGGFFLCSSRLDQNFISPLEGYKKQLIMRPWTSKKGSLSTGLYCLPELQEIVVLVAAASIMAPNAVPKQKKIILMA